MSKRTKVTALAGRVIESVTIFHDDAENPLSLEIRCIGGTYFNFDAAAEFSVKGAMMLARIGADGGLLNQRTRHFSVKGIVPCELPDEE